MLEIWKSEINKLLKNKKLFLNQEVYICKKNGIKLQRKQKEKQKIYKDSSLKTRNFRMNLKRCQ